MRGASHERENDETPSAARWTDDTLRSLDGGDLIISGRRQALELLAARFDRGAG